MHKYTSAKMTYKLVNTTMQLGTTGFPINFAHTALAPGFNFLNFMQELRRYRSVFFIGIGGIGMSALAQWCQKKGMQVGGYDRNASAITRMLQHQGIHVIHDEKPDAVPAAFLDSQQTLVVYTPAVSLQHPQLAFFQQQGFMVIKRAELLGMLSQQHKLIAIAGTHGKTTTTAMISHILHSSGVPVTAFVGGLMRNYQSNLLLSDHPESWIVAEADEYDRSFLQLRPTLTVITNVEADHLDIYGSFEELKEGFQLFANQIRPGGKHIWHESVQLTPPTHSQCLRYGQSAHSPIRLQDIHYINESLHVNFILEDTLHSIQLMQAGKHNALNAIAAFAATYQVGLAPDYISKALASFRGVARRSELWYKSPKFILIDDYAHHPTEIRCTIEAVRQLYPKRHLIAIFQPHLYSRTKDFAPAFAQALQGADQCLITDIYAARESALPGVDSPWLCQLVGKQAQYTPLPQLSHHLASLLSGENTAGYTILVMGAGNIDQQLPALLNLLKSLEHEQTKA